MSLLFLSCCTLAHAQESRIFLLENESSKEWCAYNNESVWKEEVQNTEAITVGTLHYLDNNLSLIDVTHTDESGDWMIYDHYLVNNQKLVELKRLINVIPGDKSVSLTYLLIDGKTKKIKSSIKNLSTGKLDSSEPDWLPDLPILTNIKMFDFFSLIGRSDISTKGKVCIKTSAG